MKELFLSWGLLILSVLFNVYGVFVIKLKINELGIIKVDSFKIVFDYFLVLAKIPLVISAGFSLIIAPLLFAISLSRMQITVAYPALIGLNFLFLVLLALMFLGEQMTLPKIIGMLLIFAGIYFLNK